MLPPGVTIYFARHGETDWNMALRYQGRRDVPLNATGRAQARRNGRALAAALGAHFAALDYQASPLQRASETMQIIRGELGLPELGYRVDERLVEIDYGHWEGQPFKALPQFDPDGYAARKADMWNWQPRGGESYRALSQRVASWLTDLNHDAVVVAHGGVMRVLRGLVERLAPSEIFAMPVPQDRVMLMAGRQIEWL
jgi:probable phosphoglycerate mutase